jgi:hypothetical protein
MMFAGDKLAELPAERMRLLQQCLPVCDVRPLDLFPIFDLATVWDLKVRRPVGGLDVVSLFNGDGEPAEAGFGFAELGLEPDGDYLVYDFWGEELLGKARGQFAAIVPPRANLLLAVHRALGRPQLLSTDRHVTQGAVSLDALDWDEDEQVLSGTVRLVSGSPATLTCTVPDGYSLETASVEGGELLDQRSPQEGLLTLTIGGAASGPATWRLGFSRA